MPLSMKYRCLFLLLLLFLYTAPALADLVVLPRDPQQKEKARQERMTNWRQLFPGQLPKLDISLAPDGQALLLSFTFKSPAVYSISLRGKESGGARVLTLSGEESGKGAVNQLTGANQTRRVPFIPPPNRESVWMLKVDYKLRGVANTRFGPKLTDRTLEECSARRLTVTWQNGKPQFAVTKPTSENSEELRQCGL